MYIEPATRPLIEKTEDGPRTPDGLLLRDDVMVTEFSTIAHFSQSNPSGPTQGDVAALLRRVAESITELGEVDVQDVVFHAELDDEGDAWPSVTVYFYPPEKPSR